MYDGVKLWVEDRLQIERIKEKEELSFTGIFNTKTGEILPYPLYCKRKGFEFKQMSATRLQIKGSIHKYWNHGSNENDFKIRDVKEAIKGFCNEFNLNPALATIHNLEYGVNIKPNFPANEIIHEVICYKNTRPAWPYEGDNPNFFFIEFRKNGYYLKIYDKGKQYKIDNTLRIEKKAMVSKMLKKAGIVTLKDLTKPEAMGILSKDLLNCVKFIIWNDSTVDTCKLTKKDTELFTTLVNPNKWVEYKGRKNTTTARRERRFREIVNDFGKRKIYEHITELVERKIEELTEVEMEGFLI